MLREGAATKFRNWSIEVYLGIFSYDFAVSQVTPYSQPFLASTLVRILTNSYGKMFFCCFIGDQEKNKLHLLLEIYRATSYKFLQTQRS